MPRVGGSLPGKGGGLWARRGGADACAWPAAALRALCCAPLLGGVWGASQAHTERPAMWGCSGSVCSMLEGCCGVKVGRLS